MPDVPDPALSDPELDEAIRVAGDHLGVPQEVGPYTLTGTPAGSGVGDLPWKTVVVTVAALALLLVGSALVDRRPSAPDPRRLEADLRWSVAQVVVAVDRLGATLGRLPDPSEVHGLLSEAVTYQPGDGGYVVVGERAGVRVEFDGRLPLEIWRTLELYGEGR